jgi:hypothetical protein
MRFQNQAADQHGFKPTIHMIRINPRESAAVMLYLDALLTAVAW